MITFDDLKRKVISAKSEIPPDINLVGSEKIGNPPNIKCANLIDIIFDKIIELMSKDEKKSKGEKYVVVKMAKNFKDPVKKYILLNMSSSDATDMVERAKKELDS